MKKLLIGLLIGILVFALHGAVFAQEYFFQKEQSYELADLVKKLTPADDENCNLFLNKIYIVEDLSIYWNNWASWKKENLRPESDKNKTAKPKGEQKNRMTEPYPYYREGVAGLLFNNHGQPKYEQKWVDGKLQNRGMEVGYEAVVGVCGYEENKPQFIKINTVAPSTIGMWLDEKSAKKTFADLSLHSYFAKNGYTVEHVKENQSLASYGADLCKLTFSGKRPVWVLLETSIGNKVEMTTISLFYSYDDAMKEWKEIN